MSQIPRTFKPGKLKSLALMPLVLAAPGLINKAEAQDKPPQTKIEKSEEEDLDKKIDAALKAIAKKTEPKEISEKAEKKTKVIKADPERVAALIKGMKAKQSQVEAFIKEGKLTKANAPASLERLLLKQVKRYMDLSDLPKDTKAKLDAEIKFTKTEKNINQAALDLEFLQRHFKHETKRLNALPDEQTKEIKKAWAEGKSKKEVRELMTAHFSLLDSVDHTRKLYWLMIQLLELSHGIQSGDTPKAKDLKKAAEMYRKTKLSQINLDESNKAYIMADISRKRMREIIKSFEQHMKAQGIKLS